MEAIGSGAAIAVHVAMGLALAASAGLRAFLPPLAVGLASRAGWLPLGESFEWMASTPALVAFGVAVVAELVADKVPVVDHLLDVLHTVVKPVVGAMVAVSVLSEWSPLYLTVAALILGGGVAGAVHATKAQVRVLSTATTAGVGNPVLSVSEDAGAVAGTVAAIAAPIVALAAVVAAVVAAWLLLRRVRLAGSHAGQSA